MTELFYPSGLPSGQGLVRLRELRDLLQPREVHRFRDVAIDGLGFHSQDVRPGNLFFAIRGAAGDGAKYAAEAVARGAVAVVAEEPLAVSCPVLVVDDCRAALADAARHYYRDPSRAVSVVGITGTNGKTTTAHLARACLQADRRQVGLLGTIAYEFGGRRIPATNTTPDPIRIQGYLREMADRHASACVMEVSSHSLDQQRVRGVRFAAGVFTNLTQDHLDYHKTMDGYAAAKARLFEMLEPGASAVLNIDDPASRRMAAVMGSSVHALWYGMQGKGDIRAENLVYSADGTRFDLVLPGMRTEVFLGLIGPHNVQNALAAAGAALSLGVSEMTIASALEDVRPVPGRLELVEAPRGMRDQGVRAFVDYAHTPDALDKICACLKGIVEGRLIVVFGCGGNRDKAKRPLMARAVAKWADLAVLTSDNPRDEDPEAILDQVEEGMAGSQVPWLRVTDRSEAIRAAVAEARPGDTVLIAGKGHENYQIFQGTTVPFDDRQEAGRALAAKGGGWLPR